MALRKADKKAEKQAAKAEKQAAKAEQQAVKTEKAEQKAEGDRGSAKPRTPIRVRIAQLVWLVFVVCALFLAVGALLIAVGANKDNPLVDFVLGGANVVDLGVFSRNNGIKDFTGGDAEVWNALFNWGIGAVTYLVVGRILDRVIRP